MATIRAIALALGAIILSAFIDLLMAQPPAEGMMGSAGDAVAIGNERMSWSAATGMMGQECHGYVLASNTLDQTDHGALEGYFAVGQGFDGMMRPEDPRYNWVKQFRGKPVDIVLRVRGPRQMEKIRE